MIYLGCSGWYYDHWIGLFYPPDKDKSEWLGYYTKFFNTVEVNASFYRLPFPNMLKSWYRKTPQDFIFTLKANKNITHTKPPGKNKGLIKRFCQLSDVLKEKLGCILFQFPPSLKKDLKLLETFLKLLDKEKKNVIEFRHKSWYSKDVYEILMDYNVAYCIVSAPGLPTHIEVTRDFSYIRWHGKKHWYSDNYSEGELKEWANVIKKLREKGPVFGYFNNDFGGFAPNNCITLNKLLGIQPKQ